MPELIIKHAEFVTSCSKYDQTPNHLNPEFAFLGRSNVGKSSLINALCNKKKLAQVAKAPGKTKLINYFYINEQFYFVDLPGYGYAKVSKTERDKWSQMIQYYLMKNIFLKRLYLLIDCRHGYKDYDLEMIRFMLDKGIPFSIVATKRDKISGNVWKKNKTKMEKVVENIEIIESSSAKKIGIADLLNDINEEL
jgi:GTP-binding protein